MMSTLKLSTHTRTGIHPVLTWFLPIASVVAVFSLGCIEGALESDSCTPGSYGCETLTPENSAKLQNAQNLLLGTWELSKEITGRDSVDRVLRIGDARWELEIYSVTFPSTSSSRESVYWKGVLRPLGFCLARKDAFEAQDEETCDTYEPVQSGICMGHTCKITQNTDMEGSFKLEDNSLQFDFLSVTGSTFDLTHFSEDQGYINVNLQTSGNMTAIHILDDSKGTTECTSSCSLSLSTEGLYEEMYPNAESKRIRSISLQRTSQNFTPNYESKEDFFETTLGAPEYVNELLLGSWNATVQLEGTDSVERAVAWGNLQYTLEIFEIERVDSLVGNWDFKASLRSQNLCYVSKNAEEEQTLQCDTFEDTSMGRCSQASCEGVNELPITGRFNTLNNAFTLFSNEGDIHTIDEQGYIHANIDVSTKDATLTGQVIPPTPCQSSCFWSMRTAGAYDEIYGQRSGNVSYFSMRR